MRRLRNRVASVMLVLAMLLTMMPAIAWAESNTITIDMSDLSGYTNIGQTAEDLELITAYGEDPVYLIAAPSGTSKVAFTNTMTAYPGTDTEQSQEGSAAFDLTKGCTAAFDNALMSELELSTSETFTADDTGFFVAADSEGEFSVFLIKVANGLVDADSNGQGSSSEQETTTAPTFTVKVNGVQCTDITKTEDAYEYDDHFEGHKVADLYTVTIPTLSCTVQMEFTGNVLAYNYENGKYLSGWVENASEGYTTFTGSADCNSNGVADAIQIQSPYVGNSSTLHYAVTFVPEFELYKSAYGDASMLGNNWTSENPLVAEAGATTEELNGDFLYLAADTNILENVAPEDFIATWYYSNTYDAKGEGYTKATCVTKSADFTDNGKGSLIANGTATDNEDFAFAVSQNKYTDWGMEFMDFKAYPLTNVSPGTYYYYVDISYKYGDGEVVLSTADKQAVVKINSKPIVASVSTTAKTYNGKSQTQSISVKDKSGNNLVKDTDYTVSYKNNKLVGTATVTVKGIGKYTGSFSKTFKINPVKTSITSTAGSKKALTVKWAKKTTQTTGYQVRYSRSSKFSSYTTKTVTSNKTTSKKLTGLKAKSNYYVKVRTYKTANGTKYYSAWSNAKKVKTK